MAEQQNLLLSAAEEAGTIKRFCPSEFGCEYGSIKTFPPAVTGMFQTKMAAREKLAGMGCVLVDHRLRVIQSCATFQSIKQGWVWLRGTLLQGPLVLLHAWRLITAK